MIEKKLKCEIEKMTGNVLGIGLSQNMIESISNNPEIHNFDLLSMKGFGTGKKGKAKGFDIKKLRKRYHHKTLNSIISQLDLVEQYMKTFVRDSIYICKETLYLYTSNSDYDPSYLKKRYSRFGVSIEVIKEKDGFLFIVPIQDTKNHYWKEKFYFIVDLLVDWIDMIGDILAS